MDEPLRKISSQGRVILVAGLFWSLAWGASAEPNATARATDAESLALVQQGLAKLASGDATSAIADLEKARERTPELAAVHYYLGAAHRARNETEAALACFRRSEQIAATHRDDRWRARSLFGIAWALEERAVSATSGDASGTAPSNASLESARDAWLEAKRWTDGYGTDAEKALASARLETLERILARSREAAEVKARIAERERETSETAGRSERRP